MPALQATDLEVIGFQGSSFEADAGDLEEFGMVKFAVKSNALASGHMDLLKNAGLNPVNTALSGKGELRYQQIGGDVVKSAQDISAPTKMKINIHSTSVIFSSQENGVMLAFQPQLVYSLPCGAVNGSIEMPAPKETLQKFTGFTHQRYPYPEQTMLEVYSLRDQIRALQGEEDATVRYDLTIKAYGKLIDAATESDRRAMEFSGLTREEILVRLATKGFSLISGAWGTIAWHLDIQDVTNKRRNSVFDQFESATSLEDYDRIHAALETIDRQLSEYHDLRTMPNELKSRIYDSWTGEKDENGRWTKNSVTFRESASL